MASVFDGRRAIWMWEFGRQAEQDIAAVAETARTLTGADLVLLKAMDGLDWMATYDHSPAAPAGPAAWRQLTEQGAAAAISVLPWVVPHGQDPAAEAAAHAQLGSTLILDLEPYPGFYTGSAATIPAYLAALRQAGVTELYASIDPRPSALAALDVAGWAGSTDGLLPQLYWTDFGTPALAVLPLLGSLLDLGAAVYPVLPGNGAASDLQRVWRAAAALGCRGISVWRLGSLDRGQLQAFADLAIAPAPAADGDAAALRWRISVAEHLLEGAVDQAHAEIHQLAAALGAKGGEA